MGFFCTPLVNTSEMSECTGGPLRDVVPVDASTPDLWPHPQLIALQALPTIVTTCVWMYVEGRRQRRGHSQRQRAAAAVMAFVATVISSLLVWRVFEILDCEGRVDGGAWRLTATVATVLLGGVVTLVLPDRRVRVALSVSTITASGVVAADVSLRGAWTTSLAAQPLVAVQQLWNTTTVLLLFALPQRIHATRGPSTSIPTATIVVDPFSDRVSARPPVDTTHDGARTGVWSWFW